MRICGSCTLCCKVMAITALNKPMNKWCEFCDKGVGCKIYPTRPSECRTFDCLWLRDEKFPDEFKPQKSKIVFTSEHGGGRISAHVDVSFPAAWREKKVYAELKRWATIQAQRNCQVLVFIGTRVIAILPDRDVDLGDVNVEGKTVYYEKNRATGRIEVTIEG
jgi:Fe-S-cluster containining protein